MKRFAGAGPVPFRAEPLPSGQPLTTYPNALLTPHVAGMTPEVIQAGLTMAVENIENLLKGTPTHVDIPPVRQKTLPLVRLSP
jgi:phosphoglycerate dehydrogenase-like enzyme